MFSYVSSLFLHCAISLLQKHTGAKQLTLEDPQMTMNHPYTMPTPYTSLPAQVPWRCRASGREGGGNTDKNSISLFLLSVKQLNKIPGHWMNASLSTVSSRGWLGGGEGCMCLPIGVHFHYWFWNLLGNRPIVEVGDFGSSTWYHVKPRGSWSL